MIVACLHWTALKSPTTSILSHFISFVKAILFFTVKVLEDQEDNRSSNVLSLLHLLHKY